MKRIVFYIALLFSLLVFSCGEKNPVTETEFNVSGIVLPQSVDVESGGGNRIKGCRFSWTCGNRSYKASFRFRRTL